MAATKRAVLVGNQSYGLYIGETNATDEEILKDKAVRMENVRHVAQWYGKTGGITSLAAFGPCGSRAKEADFPAETVDEMAKQVET
jgi:hypothetical protein